MWYSVPSLDFRLCGTREWFCNFVEQCLKNREMGNHGFMNSVITRFNIKMYFRGCRSEVDRWLGFATHPQLQELELTMHDVYTWSVHPREEKYCLPQFVLNATSLTILNLDCVKLEACFSINLPSLKSLSLTYVQVEDELLHNLVLGCPSLENLLVQECTTPSNLRISSSTLKFLERNGEWDQIHLEAENLELFDCGVNVCNFDIASSKKLTNLSLTDVYFSSSDSFENLISGFPLLEKLT
ncbi:hypothetical protein TIFTF001_002049 [Ficus carica]|uniref:At1g61320/AtMIF1 LRR domain-containing protein n=1 Tax=Ficus carica TaxID=3494 RepID=A0AA87ZK43_FICCA|nr:hypothetical protein TIFTF001_002049 [Ficus carica]